MSPGPSPARSRIKAALPSPSTCPSSAGSRGPGLTGRGPGKSRKHHGWAAPLPLKIAPDRGCHAFRRPPGRGKGRRIGLRGRPTEWDRVGARAGRAVGRPACGSPSGSLGSLGCALRGDDGELLEFPAAGERGRPGEPAQRCSGRGAEPLDPRTRLRRSGGVGDFPARSRTSPGRGRRLPSPAAPSGLAGVQARPPRPGRRTGARCRRRPSPSRLVSLSARHLCKESEALRPPGEGAGAQAQAPGRPGSSRGGGGKTRERIPSAGRAALPARAEASKGFSGGGKRGSPLPGPPPLATTEPVGDGPLGRSWILSPTPAAACFGGDSAPCWSESGKETREGGPPISRSPEIQGSW